MDIYYNIKGHLTVPDDAVLSDTQDNLIILADGGTVSVQPSIELNTGVDDDNHRNINYNEARDVGVIIGDYDRETSTLDNVGRPVNDYLTRFRDLSENISLSDVKTTHTDYESSVKLSDLRIGDEFSYRGMEVKNRITDIGTRTITYIKLDQEDQRNYNGPPYSVLEHSLAAEELGAIDLVKKD